MLKTIGAHVASFVLALLASSLLVFGALFIAPGSPLTVLTGGRQLSPEAADVLRQHYHLDDPFLTRYWSWLTDVALHGDFGASVIAGQPVSQLLEPRVGSTLLLLAMASLLMVVVGIGLGLASALGGRKLGAAIQAVSAVGVALPSFVVAILLIKFLSVGLGWFPVYGSGSGLADEAYHLVLPAVALALSGWSYLARVTRVSVRAESGREHVQTARSRGLPEAQIVRRHVLRNAMIPISTVAGLTVAGTIAATVVVESAFGLDGLGSLLVQSVTSKDFAVVQAVSLVLVALFLVVNLVVDLAYSVIDPRVRHARRR